MSRPFAKAVVVLIGIATLGSARCLSVCFINPCNATASQQHSQNNGKASDCHHQNGKPNGDQKREPCSHQALTGLALPSSGHIDANPVSSFLAVPLDNVDHSVTDSSPRDRASAHFLAPLSPPGTASVAILRI